MRRVRDVCSPCKIPRANVNPACKFRPSGGDVREPNLTEVTQMVESEKYDSEKTLAKQGCSATGPGPTGCYERIRPLKGTISSASWRIQPEGFFDLANPLTADV